jgi:hypothetical protein
MWLKFKLLRALTIDNFESVKSKSFNNRNFESINFYKRPRSTVLSNSEWINLKINWLISYGTKQFNSLPGDL